MDLLKSIQINLKTLFQLLSEYVWSSVSEGVGKFECIGIALCVRVTEKESKYVQSKIHTQSTNQQLTIDSFFFPYLLVMATVLHFPKVQPA